MPQMRHGRTAGGHSVWFAATHDQQPLHIAIMVALMLALMAAAMMMLR
jgi:hypothetical protein